MLTLRRVIKKFLVNLIVTLLVKLNQKLRKEVKGESYRMKQGNYRNRLGREEIYFQKCNIDFAKLSFKELGDMILLIVEAKRQLADLAKQAGCGASFADDLFIELALFKPQSHYNMIKIAHVAQHDYNNSLVGFVNWLAREQGFEVVEG